MASARSWPRRRRVSVIVTTARSGAKRAASAAQFGHDAGRRDDEERVSGGVGLLGVADQRQRLHGLAQPHVVGEDAAEPVAPEEAQPVEALALVGPQLCGQGRGSSVVGELVERQQARDLLLPRPCLALDHAQRGQLLPQARLEPADPQRAAGPSPAAPAPPR